MPHLTVASQVYNAPLIILAGLATVAFSSRVRVCAGDLMTRSKRHCDPQLAILMLIAASIIGDETRPTNCLHREIGEVI